MQKAFDIILNALRVELGIEKEPARNAFPPLGRSGQRTKTERDSYGQESGSQYGRRPDAGLESRIEPKLSIFYTRSLTARTISSIS